MSTALESSSDCPVRDYLDDKSIEWKYEKPDYTVINEKYMKEKRNNHKADSLEKLVENLVKTWEAESTHKGRIEDWQTVDRETFRISVNGGRKFNITDNIALGNYKMFLMDCPIFTAKNETNDSALDLFKGTFKSGFAWELLELQSGPPVVSFTWRHWGTWEGNFKSEEPTGETIEMFGSSVVRVTDKLKIESIEVFYDHNPMMAKLTGFHKKCPGWGDNLE